MQNEIVEGFRLSPQQKQVWLLQQDSCAYCSQCALRLEGKLNTKFLKQALQIVINRHEILRTTFYHHVEMKVPIQIVSDSSTLPWNHIDLIGLSSREHEVEIERFIQQERRLPFNFKQQASLLRLSLISLSEPQSILIITLPSLCADSWTLKNIFNEIVQSYNVCLKGESLVDEVTQYSQFSEWQHELLKEEEADNGRAYWRQQNLWNIPTITLPFEGKLDEKTRFAPDVYELSINPDTVTKIETFAQSHNTTISEFLFTCWQTLLWRLTREPNIAIATIGSGREYEELQGILGLLAKSLPARYSFNPNLKFVDVLWRTVETLSSIHKWQDYFIGEESAGVLGNAVNFPISFEFEKWPSKCCAGGVSFSFYKQYVCFDRFKLKLTCSYKEESLFAEFHYDASLFLAESIQGLAGQFQTLLESAANNPDAAIGELEILSIREQQQLLVEFNNTQTSYSQDKCIHQLFEEQAAHTPDQIAVVFEDQQLTYAELNARANQLAHYLQSLGIKPKTLVGICVERSLQIIIALLGILKAGGAYLPLDPALPAESIAFRLQDAQVSVLLTQHSLVETLPQHAARVVSLDTDWEFIAQKSTANPSRGVASEDLVYVLFTSGSTGNPKGVAIEHRQLVNYLHSILDRLGRPSGASFATVSTFAADLGNTAIFPALCTGGCLHIVSSERASDPEALADYFQRYPIDFLKIVPSHLSVLLSAAQIRQILPRQCLILGGEVVRWELIEQLQLHAPDCRILNHYGPTETTVGALTYSVQSRLASQGSQTVPLGRPLANTQVYVLDEQLRPVPIGVSGELYIGGAGLARGYLNRPELTAERFIPNPFSTALRERLYKTGDLARYLSDGTLEFLGRTDHQVKVRGFRIELGEIEAVLSQQPDVRQAVVLAREDEPGNQCLVAYLVPRSGQAPSVSDLRSFLKEKLPEYMVPSAFVRLKSLPLTPNGKVDRQALPAPDPARPELAGTFVAPRTPIEKVLADIWSQILGIEQVGIYDNFFELGGHSLLTTQLLVRMRDAFQVDLSLRYLFEAPTIAGLAESIQVVQRKEPSTTIGTETLTTLRADAVLESTICPGTATYNTVVSEDAIFLTGATGFLGAFLLYELLQQTQADIYCLVRSPNTELGKKRLQGSLESYLLWNESLSSRIIPVVGNLSQPLLGLSEKQFRAMASRLDVIYHNGAWVHHTSPYSTLKAANVLGTQEVLRLASQIKVKPVHFISTISVFSPVDYSGVKIVREQDSLDDNQLPSDGYAQSKWVAEKLVTSAQNRGLPVCIYRPGRISGHSKTGVFNVNDFLYRLIVGCIQLGSAPEGDMVVEIAPVDYVSQAIVHLSRQATSIGKAFHLVNPCPLHLSKLINWICSIGYPIRQLSYDQWRIELLNIARHFPDHALYPLMPFFPAREPQDRASNSAVLKFDCQNTLDGLVGTSTICPPVDDRLLHTYFSYLRDNGFLDVPA